MNLEKATKLARKNMKEKLKSGENILGWSQEEFIIRMGNVQRASDNYVPNKNKEGRNG